MDIIEVEEVGAIDQRYTIEGLDFIASGNQYLTFTLGNEHYAVDILCVREIRGWEPPTLVPNVPKHIKGVINLRGTIVPIIDLRIQFSIGEVTYLPTTVVIVLTNESTDRPRTMGYIVDAVSDVLNAEDSDIKKAPAFASTIQPHYIDGLVNSGEKVITLLNIESLQNLELDKVNND